MEVVSYDFDFPSKISNKILSHEIKDPKHSPTLVKNYILLLLQLSKLKNGRKCSAANLRSLKCNQNCGKYSSKLNKKKKYIPKNSKYSNFRDQNGVIEEEFT